MKNALISLQSYLRNIVFACFMSLWLSMFAHATHENNQQLIHVKSQASQMSEHSSGQHPYSDELWLIGSFFISLTVLVILLRYLHRK